MGRKGTKRHHQANPHMNQNVSTNVTHSSVETIPYREDQADITIKSLNLNIFKSKKCMLKEIHASYYTGITIGELASKHFLSESNLRKKFVEAMGISPKQYIINLRLMEAKRLLQQTDKAIESISSEVGFTSSSRFYEFFVKSSGITPLEWRVRHQRQT